MFELGLIVVSIFVPIVPQTIVIVTSLALLAAQ